MADFEILQEERSVSCPFCGRRSKIAIELPATKPRAWTHRCPTCDKPWRVSIGIRRGRAELDVSPIVGEKKQAEKKSKTTAKAAKKPKKRPN